jgi:hypothetical protein
MSPDAKTHNHTDHILIEGESVWCTSVLHTQPFKAADCDSDHYLMVTKVKDRPAANKQRSHRFYMERLNLKKLNEVEGKEQYCVEVPNRFAALEDLDNEVHIIRAWETITENIKISGKESIDNHELKENMCHSSNTWEPQ